MLRRFLLGCGILATLLYGALMTVVGYSGYSPISQTVSELSAIGAPSRSVAAALIVIFDALTLAFAVGVWLSATHKRSLRVVAAAMLVSAIFDLSLGPFAAMHQRDVLAAGGGTVSDSLHMVIGAVDVVFMLLFMGFGAAALGWRFRIYTIASIMLLLAFGGLMTLDSPRIQANLPTPWIGLTERIMIFASMLWRGVLAVALLRVADVKHRPARESSRRAVTTRRRWAGMQP